MTSSAYTVEVQCGSDNGYDGRIGVRVSSIFVIGIGSLLGALLPVWAARSKKMRVPPVAFFITKYFGSGVIIATAFIHLLSPATEALQSPCLTGPITGYSWAEGIALMTVFVMFFIELMAARFEVFGENEHDVEASDPARAMIQKSEKYRDALSAKHLVPSQSSGESSFNGGNERIKGNSAPKIHNHSNPHNHTELTPIKPNEDPPNTRQSTVPGREDDFTYPPGGEDHLGHQRDHETDDDHFLAQMTAIFILEFGVIFHSIFIGLTLAVTGDEFNVLYIVLAFHQTFEGLGLGSRLATTQWPKKKRWIPWALGTAYGLTTPIAIAIGLGVRTTFSPGSQSTLIINGVFDSISAGILIYTGLVELMAHEFMFNPEMRKSSIKMMLFAYLCMCIGAGLMALLGKWA